MNDSPEHKSIFMRWWFWVIFVLLIAGTWYVKGYIEWRAATAGDKTYNALSQQYWNYLKGRSDALEQQYRNDNYGGETPEETLRLFVEALEAKDLELASKYYLPEHQADQFAELNESNQNGYLSMYISILNKDQESIIFEDKTTAEIRFIENGDQIHLEQFQINPFSKKWKISKL